MGSLSNLYISQSYQSLLHFSTDNSASANLTMLQDGVGQNLYTYVNTNGDLLTSHSISSSIIEATNLIIKNKIELTGSIDIDGPVTASSAFIEGNLSVSGTLFANKVITLIESSSIIYSSGSNILGDEIGDTQTLIGSTIMSGSAALSGSMGISANLNVIGNISSSTISGIGNVTLYSQSVDARLDYLEGPFSTSVDSRLDIVEATASLYVPFSQSVDARLDVVEATASLYVPFSTSVDSRLDGLEATASYLNTTFSQSVDFRLDELESWSSSLQTTFVTETQLTQTASLLQNGINQKLDTASFNSYTQSVTNTIATLATTASLNSLSSSVAISINNINSKTGSYATTGSNTFNGNNVFSGSVRGNVIPLTISSNTASMDCSLGNFFTLTLVSGSATRLIPTNILPGETITLKILQVSTGSVGTINYPSSIKFPSGLAYSASFITSSQDIISFVTFDSNTLFGTSIYNLL
jgi:hypothetical protein